MLLFLSLSLSPRFTFIANARCSKKVKNGKENWSRKKIVKERRLAECACAQCHRQFKFMKFFAS